MIGSDRHRQITSFPPHFPAIHPSGHSVQIRSQQLAETKTVQILGQKIQKKPIAQSQLGQRLPCNNQRRLGRCLRSVQPYGEETEANLTAADQRQMDGQHEQSQDDEQNEPEPDEQVDFFVDHIDGQDAEGVYGHNFAGRSVVEETTFGHFGKQKCCRVDLQLLFRLGQQIVACDVVAVRVEEAVEETVEKDELDANIGQGNELTEKESAIIQNVLV